MIEEWQNKINGSHVWAEESKLGPDDGYRVWLVNGAEPMWYSKYLFEDYYRKVRNERNNK